ncbi:MAG: endonuclease IV [Ruminococcaceae bacterium]|nr:endonuclease IV [Oscillospiraceae bacterium]
MRALFGPGGNSLSFYASGKKSTVDAPKWIADFGLDCYEYQAGKGLFGSDETFKKIGDEAKKNNIRMSLHAPYYISLSGIEEEKRLKSVDYILKSVRAAELMNAELIVIHTGSASKISREAAVELAKDTISKALEAVDGTNVTLALETMGKLNQLGTLEEVLEICSIDKRLCPVVDFGHLNARNIGNYFVTTDDYRRVFNLIAEKLGDKYADTLHCHFSKIEFTNSGEKKHLTFEDTVFGPPFEPLMEAIYKENVSPRIICESDGTMAEDALAMKNYYNSLFN